MRFLRYPQKHQTDISGSAWNNKLVEQCVRGILEQNGGEKKKKKTLRPYYLVVARDYLKHERSTPFERLYDRF